MKIAIVNRPGGFSDRWIEYCRKHNISYKEVNPYASDIVEQVKDCDAFMWHHHQANYKDVLFAKQLLFSLEKAGKVVFPNTASGTLFDDKVGEKYLLEAIGAPVVPSYVFYTKQEALDWITKTTFPKVFKLRGGAGSANVMLARTAADAKKLVRKAFGKGFPQYSSWSNLKERIRKYRLGKTDLKDVLKGVARFFVKPEFAKMHGSEKGYVYFQDFIPNNNYDTRIVVIGSKYAMGEVRYCRKGDFRASGSSEFDYVNISTKILKEAFLAAKKLGMQSVAFDFILHEGKPLIVEYCYGFGFHGIEKSGGYWTEDLVWHKEERLDFCGWMVEEVMKEVNAKQQI